VSKPKVTVSLDADLAIDVMMLSGAGSPQDAVELIVRDYLARSRRTEARTGEADDSGRLRHEQHGDAERG
jgi:Arc/MetJ family transcription regulator